MKTHNKVSLQIISFLIIINVNLHAFSTYEEIDKKVKKNSTVSGSAWSKDYGYNHAYDKSITDKNPNLPKIHAGIDILIPNGTKLYSLTDGRVVKIKEPIGAVYIRPKNQSGTIVYMHLSTISVDINDTISENDYIGKSGNKGSKAYHLHIEWIKDDSNNPIEIAASNQGDKNTATDTTYDSKDLNIKGVIDGAGSLVRPNEDCFGCNKDELRLHKNTKSGSTGIFQWLYDAGTCNQIDIHSNKNIGEVVIKVKSWNDHNVQKAYKTKLNANDLFSIKALGIWNLISITTTGELSEETSIYANCKSYPNEFYNANRKEIAKDNINITNEYFLAGTGSVITKGLNYKNNHYGQYKDWAITHENDALNSMTTFQWYTNSSCKEITLSKEGTNSKVSINSVSIKGWHEKEWEKTTCNSLPCNIEAPSLDFYYLLKVKIPAGHSSSYLHNVNVQAKCN